MPKLDVIKVNWVNDSEAHIYPPGDRDSWWMRPAPKYLGDGVLWELWSGSADDDAEGYFDTPDAALAYVSELFDDAPVVVTRERDQ